MHRRILAAIAASSGLLVALLTVAVPVSAQTSVQGGDGLRVSPVRSDLTIKPGQNSSLSVSVTNVSSSPTQLKAIINDFGAGDDESGQPKVYLDENASAPTHGLKNYITKIDNFTLQPQERKEIKVTIRIPANAGGGGYYGVVRFAPVSVSGKENVTLSGSVGTLVLVTVPGNVIEKASLDTFNVARMNGSTLGKASNFFTNGGKDSKGKGIQTVLRIHNAGNVQLAPFGKVILKKGGSQVASYEFNNTVPKNVVLPDSTRRFQIDLGDKAASFGRYTIEGNFGYGANGQLLSASTSFYVVPVPYLVAAIVLLLLVVAAIIIVPRMLKSHDRKLLRRIRSRGKR